MASWKRSEARVVRPYRTADECLYGVRLRLQAAADFDERTFFDTKEVDLSDLLPEFFLAVDPTVLDSATDLAPADTKLVIRLTDKRLHRSEIVFASPLNSLPETWRLPVEVKNRFAWSFGIDITVAVVLGASRPMTPGQPHMRGQWLARKDFSVHARTERRRVALEKWTEDDFAAQGLPRETVYWIRFSADDLNQRFDDMEEAFVICVAASVYDALAVGSDASPARASMSLIAADVLAEVVSKGLKELDSVDQLQHGSLLQASLASIEKATGAQPAKLQRLVTDGDLSAVRAFAQATVRARRALMRINSVR